MKRVRTLYGPNSEVLKQFVPVAGGPSMVAFDAAGSGRRLSTWQPPRGTSMASIVRSDLRDLRDRSRDAVRKSLYASAAKQSWVGNVVGTGISLSSMVEGDTDLQQAIKALWEEWTDEADAEGVSDLYGMQRTVASALFEAGEIFVRFRPRRLGDGLSVPLQLQLIESEQVPLEKNEVLPSGNIVRMGIEFDRVIQSRRVAYWMFRNHPGDYRTGQAVGDVVRVPASEVLHIFDPLRPGQIRGVPKLSTSLLTLWELDKFTDNVLVKQTIGAGFTGFFTWTASGDAGPPLGATKPDGAPADSTVGFTTVEPGTFPELPPGADVKFATPPDIGAQFDAFMKVELRAIASALDTLYEHLTGDYAGVTYTSMRAAVLEIRRRIEQLQHHVLIFQLCRPIYWRWLEAAVMAGALPTLSASRYVKDQRAVRKARWLPDPWPWVDPIKDRMAEILAVRAGMKSLSDVIEQEGETTADTLRQLSEDFKLAVDTYGLILDSDASRTAKSGAIQKAESAALGG